MPYPLRGSQNYNATGGINNKASLYITGEGEFINLQNVDFRTPGALSSFAGSTLFVVNGSTSPVNGMAAVFSGVWVPVGYTGTAGTTCLLLATDSNYVSDVAGGGFSAILPYAFTNNPTQTDFAYGGTALFGCNGRDFWRTAGPGTTMWQFSMPKPIAPGIAQTTSGGTAGLSGTVVFYYSLVRSDGFYGPAVAVTYSATGGTLQTFRRAANVNTTVGAGLSFGSWGISGIQAWASLNGGLPLGYNTLLGLTTGAQSITMTFDWTAAGFTLVTPQPLDYQGTMLYGLGTNQGSISGTYVTSGNPGLCAVFANRLFTAQWGTGYFNRIVFSEAGEPEKALYENFFDLGADGSAPSAMLPYFTQLVLFKPAATWALSGTGPDSFVLTQISSIYGCLSKNACVVWNQNCWFLDEKGIFEFNGANVQCVSNKVDDYFQRMNMAAAVNTACMIHVKDRNEVWCAIPIDGSSVNNIIIVYDYLAQAWTTRTTPPGPLTALPVISNGSTKSTVYYGSSGQIGTFGSSLVGDNGVGITTVIQSRYIEGDFGNAVTKMYRRLFVDAAIPPGMTFPILVNLYADKASTPYYSVTMILTGFQDRIDFGVPAKSVSVEAIYTGATFFQFNGFTIDMRFQRNC